MTARRKAARGAEPPVQTAPRRTVWVPSHRTWCPLTPEDRAAEVRTYDPADPPADFPGRPGLHVQEP